MRSLLLSILCTAFCLPSLPAQGEEVFLDFKEAEAAFEQAAKEGKRVLVYQDWPG